MRALVLLAVTACSFPTKHAGAPSDGSGGDGNGIDSAIDGPRSADAMIDSGPSMRRVFVTSATFNPVFGMASNADNNCAGIAQGAMLGGTWRAWISQPNQDAVLRMTHSTVPYTLVDRTTIVAANWAQLTSGLLQHPIDRDEQNLVPPPQGGCADPQCVTVWTATDPAGNYLPPDCQDWTTTGTFTMGFIGNSQAVNADWTASSSFQANCSQRARLYCIEQ